MKRKCAICRTPATRITPAGKGWCGGEDCGAQLALALLEKQRAAKAKKERAEHRARKKECEPIGKLLKRVERECNAYIKELYYGEPCFTCGKNRDLMEAGHYMPVGAGGGSPVRFHTNNIRPQCHPCNVYGGGGKHPNYRPHLVVEIGEAAVEEIERLHHTPVKWDRDDLERQRAWFAAETRRLKREREQRGMV